MKVAIVQWAEWFRDGEAFPLNEEIPLRADQLVVVKHSLGMDVGRVKRLREVEDNDDLEEKEIVRVATEEDKDKWKELEKQGKEAFRQCKELIDKHDLNMKLVRAYVSFDERRLTFTFIADGRVDFRDLVKDLTKSFKKLIRLQQIGIRDEARLMGDVGPCGRQLCCATHLNDLKSVTSDLIELQQLSHRGSDRLSGMCGRLCCCLAYEEEGYAKLLNELPPLRSRVRTKEGDGFVMRHHLLKKTVEVNLDEKDKDGIIEISAKDLKILSLPKNNCDKNCPARSKQNGKK